MNSKHEPASKSVAPRQSAGGKARAAKLTPEERSAIARKAAQDRWAEVAVVAGDADKPLTIGGIDIECYVLADGTRVITQASFMRAIGRNPRGSGPADETLPPFLRTQSLSSYITDELVEQSRPLAFTLPRGGRAKGYRAELLPVVCDLYLKARQEKKLPRSGNQDHVAAQAEILVRGLAQVGIIALVDEVTGYQEIRARDALATILENFVAKELQAWVRTFPDDYYREMFRLRGLRYPNSPVQRPQYFGLLTNDIVYKRLAPGVLEELKRVQRKGATGKPKDKLFQRLTNNAGYPKLREHLGSVVTLMKMSPDWASFKTNLDRIHPKYDDTIPMNFDGDQPGL
jgi:hypothetical protein